MTAAWKNPSGDHSAMLKRMMIRDFLVIVLQAFVFDVLSHRKRHVARRGHDLTHYCETPQDFVALARPQIKATSGAEQGQQAECKRVASPASPAPTVPHRSLA
jgi:hypothetical protein